MDITIPKRRGRWAGDESFTSLSVKKRTFQEETRSPGVRTGGWGVGDDDKDKSGNDDENMSGDDDENMSGDDREEEEGEEGGWRGFVNNWLVVNSEDDNNDDDDEEEADNDDGFVDNWEYNYDYNYLYRGTQFNLSTLCIGNKIR